MPTAQPCRSSVFRSSLHSRSPLALSSGKIPLPMFILAASVALFFSALTWLLYISLEPYVRRHWPGTIISWTRMLSGQFKDPVLGRDILLGALFGVTSAVLEHLQPLVEAAVGQPPIHPLGVAAAFTMEGVRGASGKAPLWQKPAGQLNFFTLFESLLAAPAARQSARPIPRCPSTLGSRPIGLSP